MVECPKCGSHNANTQMVDTGGFSTTRTDMKKSGNGLGGNIHNFNRGILALGTGGVSNLFVKKAKGSEKTTSTTSYTPHNKKISICQDCGFSFDTEYGARVIERRKRNAEYEELREKARQEKEALKLKKREEKQKRDAGRETAPFLQKTAIVLLFCIFLPPAGIYLAIKSRAIVKKKPWIIGTSVWAVVLGVALISGATNPQYTKSDERITCEYIVCSKLERYGDENILEKLYKVGIRSVQSAGNLKNGKAELEVDDGKYYKTTVVVIEIQDNKLSSVYNKEFPSIVYYSVDESQQTTQYPGEEVIKKKEVEPKCSLESDCQKLLGYGDDNVLYILGSIGVKEIASVKDMEYNMVKLYTVDEQKEQYWLNIIYDVNNKVVNIDNAQYDLTYWSTLDGATVLEYPSKEEVEKRKAEEATAIAEARANEPPIGSLEVHTKDLVRQALSPIKKAKFPLLAWDNGWANDAIGVYYLSSYVDTQNEYGTDLRLSFQTGYRKEGDNWELVWFILNGTIYVDKR